MAEDRFETPENAYRGASQALDFFVTGLSSLFLVSSLFVETGDHAWRTTNILQVIAMLLFAVAVISGVRKLEGFVAILGTNFALARAEEHHSAGTPASSSGVLKDLYDTVERLSVTASRAHVTRNWSFTLGILCLVVSRSFAALMAI